MSGKVRNLVHNIPYPKAAPVCEYVAIPLGSSSAAPVTSPGPSFCQKDGCDLRICWLLGNFLNNAAVLLRTRALITSAALDAEIRRDSVAHPHAACCMTASGF